MEEIIIVGSGCAGMGAAIYAARAGANPLVLEGSRPGGALTTTSDVENFPAFPDGIGGFDLVWRMRQQAEKFGARIENSDIERVDFSGGTKRLFAAGGKVYEAKKVIIATGSSPRLTGAKGEAELYGGRGVSTCATCDGAFYRGADVAVVGGGDTACEEALFLSKFCASVKIIHRRDSFRASRIMADRVAANPKISVLWDSVVVEVKAGADGKCSAVVVENAKTGVRAEVPCRCMFAAIGHTPNTAAFAGAVETDSDGYIVARGASGVETDVENVYVAGDCADKIFRQAITAVSSGCKAAIMATS